MNYDLTTTNSKHNYKLSIEDKEQIILDYTLNHTKENIQSICQRHSISKRTLYDIVNKYSDKDKQEITNKYIKRYKQNFTKRSNAIIDKALNRIEQELYNNDNNINISQLSTMIGILYDKTRLEDNLSTSNNSFNININIDK